MIRYIKKKKTETNGSDFLYTRIILIILAYENTGKFTVQCNLLSRFPTDLHQCGPCQHYTASLLDIPFSGGHLGPEL